MRPVTRRPPEGSSNGSSTAARVVVAAERPTTGPSRRRWGRVAVGGAVTLVGSWIFAALYLSAGDRVEVLVVARDVPRLEAIERADLRAVRLADAPDVATVPASRLEELIGRRTAVDLVAGSVLAEEQVLSASAQLVGADEAVVGLVAGPGEAPTSSLDRGTGVLLIIRPAPGESDAVVTVEGWVLDASGEALSTREQPFEVVVPRTDAEAVSAAAADRRVSIVALPGGGP